MTLNSFSLSGFLTVFLGIVFLAGGTAVNAEVTITRLANEGVILDDGETRIMIDGLVVEPYALYGGLPPELAQQFATATGIFADIDVALASHKHHDHNQPQFACNFLKASEKTKLVTSIQVIELVRERCRPLVQTSSRVGAIDPRYAQPVELPIGSAKVKVFLLSHGTGKYARLQNFGHLVDMGGVRILHIGDAAM
ncbi:MAG: MBL fold metallo-hydrolase, partial [Saprospiraceae bacterium]|nr:MBL fold metallo-hydrolase [Saprospiraceae bacterium]